MNVGKLIEKLQALPSDANVALLWDGRARGDADHVYLCRRGDVIIAPGGENVYDPSERPADAPGRHHGPHWRLPEVDAHGNPVPDEEEPT